MGTSQRGRARLRVGKFTRPRRLAACPLSGAPAPGAPARARRGDRWRADSGAAAAEFALVLPVLCLLLFAILEFGIALYNYEMLTGGVRAGSRNFAIRRGTNNPWSGTKSVIENASPGLSATTLDSRIHLFVNNTECTSDAACVTAIVGGATAKVTATYPCTIQVMGINAAPNCVLT